MSADGSFPPDVRAGILNRTLGRCAGCGASSPMTVQHRTARGMGGRSRLGADLTSHPANGVALCGSGTTGCHGWAEHNPWMAAVLGWRLEAGTDPIDAPLYAVAGPWRWAAVDEEGSLVFVDYPAPWPASVVDAVDSLDADVRART